MTGLKKSEANNLEMTKYISIFSKPFPPCAAPVQCVSCSSDCSGSPGLPRDSAGLQGGLGRASCCTGLCIPAPGPVYSHPPSSCPLSSTPPPPLHLLSPPRHPAPPAPQQPARHQQRVEGGIVTRPIQAMSGIFVGKHQAVTTQRLSSYI